MAGYDKPVVDMRVVDAPPAVSKEGANVLYLAQLLPYPADAGPKVRIYHVLRYLAQHNQVTLVAFGRPSDAPEAETHLKEFCAAVHVVPLQRSRINDLRAMTQSLLSRRSFIIHRDYVPEMARLVDRLLAEGDFQAVHADQLWMAQYALRARYFSSAQTSPRLVLDEHNACFQIFQRLAQGERNPAKKLLLEREWRMLARYEATACSQFDQVVTVSEQDRAILWRMTLQAAGTGPKFHTIPICVDRAQTEPVQAQPGARNVLHLGTMFWLPNVEGVLWFARQVWPRVLEAVPDATVTIAGKNPPKAIEALADGSLAGSNGSGFPASGGPAIEVTGYVPDPRPYLEQAGVFIVPLLSGSGMRVKILDAWSWGLPVVSTAIGAEGVDYRDGENILIADTPEQFAQAVIRVLLDPDLARRLRLNGRQWVESRYDWRNVYQAWDAVYAGVSGLAGGAHE